MEYILVDVKNGDQFSQEFKYESKAVITAVSTWKSMTQHDKSKRTAFYVLKSINPNEEAENHFDGTIVWQAV